MLEVDGAVGLILVGFWVHAIIDVVRADEAAVRHLPKQTWLLLVVSLPEVGALVWMAAGRPERPVPRLSGTYDGTIRRRPVGPEDRPDFAAWLHQLNVTPPKPAVLPPPVDPEPTDPDEPVPPR